MKTGEIYKVNHNRKGIFNILLTGETEDWITGIIVEGQEKITIRKSLCKLTDER